MGKVRPQGQERKDGEEVDTVRMEAREVLMLDRNGRRDEAIARAHELVARHPDSALVAQLAAGLHYDSTTRAIAAKDKEGITKNCNAARDLYLHAQRLAPNCVEITARLAVARIRCFHDGEALPEIERALAIPFPCDPAENNVAYDLMPENTPKARVENAKKWATERHQRILSCVRNKTIPEYVRSLIEYAGSHGVANAIQPVREFAERYSYSVRAPLTNAYINLEFARGLAPGIDKRQFLSRILRELNSVANQFETSLVLAMVRTKLLFVLGLYTAMASEYVRAMDIESPPDPQFEDIPPGSVRGDKHEDRISSIRTELVSLQQKLLLIARDYWSSLTREQQRGVLSAGFNSMHQYYVRVYDDSHEAAKTISDALSFVKKNRSWRYWICPYCVGKKIPDTDALLKHMHKKHSEGSVWPKLLSVLDPKLIPDTSQGERFSDDATLCQDPDEHYVFHFKRVRPSSINQPMPFSEIRGNKCTEGVEILEKIKLKLKNAPADVLSTKFNQACAEIRDLWHYFLKVSALDFRVVIVPLAVSFIWERFLQCIGDDKKVASKSVDAADIDAVFPYVGDTPEIDEMFLHVDDALDENAADNDAIRPQVPDAPDSNVANIDTILPNVVDTSNSDAASDSVCPNPGDIPDNSAANIDGICLSTLNTAGVPNRNAADNDVIHPNVPDASDSNVANIDAILPNVVDTSNSNAVSDAVRPNPGDVPNNNAANIDGICLSTLNTAGVPDRNAADDDAIRPNVPDASDCNVANIDGILPNIVDASNSNAASDAVYPNTGDVPENKAASNIGGICLSTLNTAGIPDRNAADNDAICPNIPDASDSKGAHIDAILPNVVDAFNSNAANDAVCPDSGDVPDNNAANIDGICLNTLNTAGINDRNTSDNDAVCPNVGDALDSKAADIDAKFPNVANAPDRNFGVKDCSNFSHENEAQKYEVNEKPENIMLPCSDVTSTHGEDKERNSDVEDGSNLSHENQANKYEVNEKTENIMLPCSEVTSIEGEDKERNSDVKDGSNLSQENKAQKYQVKEKPENIVLPCSDVTSTDAEDKESESHVKDENYGATVNENESSPPTEMVEYSDKLDATPGHMEANLKDDSLHGTSLRSLSEHTYSTANTASRLLGEFDQSTEEIASISCYQKSIDVLNKNNVEEDLRFLNMIIQLLWNLKDFRNEILWQYSFDIMHDGLCVSEKLYKIFSAWEKNEHSKMVHLLSDVKNTLCGIANDSNMFQTAGRNIASEIMTFILQGLQKFDNSIYVGSMRIVMDAPCRSCVWYTLGLFGIRLKQLMSCRCGEWFGEEYFSYFHKLDASLLHSTKINSFEDLPMLMDSQSNYVRSCNKCSGSVNQIGCFLLKGPQFFTIVLKDWLGSDESKATLSEALFGIASPLDITILYNGVTFPHEVGHSATKYRLVSAISYTECGGYACVARDQDKWLKYCPMMVKTVDSWEEQLELYRQINLQPEVLIYEVIK